MVLLVKLLAVLALVRFSVASTWKSKRFSSPMFFDPSRMQISATGHSKPDKPAPLTRYPACTANGALGDGDDEHRLTAVFQGNLHSTVVYISQISRQVRYCS